ncbi:MAG: hypothetical protein MUO72_14440 [Bacteroidales bacterium]|nr:hypothetical protein [Bacteroidales bacterium]
MKNTPFVLKNVILEAGDGFFLCKSKGDGFLVNGDDLTIEELRNRIGSSKWVLQSQIKSHEIIRKVNPTALNTTRIVTILNGKEPVFLTGFQSFATGSMEIDSWGRGAIYVGFDYKKSCLTGNGFYHPAIKNKSISEFNTPLSSTTGVGY